MTVGQFVKFRPGFGMDEVPAIVTRVWSDSMVNLTSFPDGSFPMTHSSVPKAMSPEQGFAFREIG